MSTYKPIRFVEEPIEVLYDDPPVLEKKTGPPNAILWREFRYRIVEVISEWHDYHRRGRMARNMRPEHARTAQKRGSWGVGKDYYRVVTDSGRIFDIYFDRAPKSVDKRKGAWFLFQELSCSF
jgi:hypothetical protein